MSDLVSSAPTRVALMQAFDEIAHLADEQSQENSLLIRVVRVDGSTIEGYVTGVGPFALILVDKSTRGFIEVAPGDVRTLDVETSRRGRQWIMAVLGIIVATAVLVGWATLPWVTPNQNGVMIGFVILVLPILMYGGVLLDRMGLGRWLTKWQPLYPPPGA